MAYGGSAESCHRPRKRFDMRWLIAAVAAIAIGEGLFIAGLLYARPTAVPGSVMIGTTQPGVEVFSRRPPVGATPYKLDVGAGVRSIQVLASDSRIADAIADGPDYDRPS